MNEINDSYNHEHFALYAIMYRLDELKLMDKVFEEGALNSHVAFGSHRAGANEQRKVHEVLDSVRSQVINAKAKHY